MDAELLVPQWRQVYLVDRRHTRNDHLALGASPAHRILDARGGTRTFEGDVEAAEYRGLADWQRVGRPAGQLCKLLIPLFSRGYHLLGAEGSGQLLLMSVLGNCDDGRRRCEGLQRRYRQQPNGATAYYQHPSSLWHMGLQHTVHGAAQRFGQDRSLVSDRDGNGMKLALVRHQL